MRRIFPLLAASIGGSLVTLLVMQPLPMLPAADAQVRTRGLLDKLDSLAERREEPAVGIVRTARKTVSPREMTPAEQTAHDVYEACNDAVVNISVTTIRRNLFGARPETGDSGSGVVIDPRGLVLTNAHVIEGARQVRVTLADGREFIGERVGVDTLNDIALLRIDPEGSPLSSVSLGTSEDLFVGQSVYAIGNPFGLQRTLSTGTVAALGRPLDVQDNWVIKSVIQIDAAINPGNSGGPLLDSEGRLIGMNTAIAAETRQSAGIGFALPVDLIRRSLPDLMEHGRVIRGDLGIATLSESPQGLRVLQLDVGGPAETAGIRGPVIEERREGNYIVRRIDRSKADLIVALDGATVTSAADLFARLDGKRPGETVELTVMRDKSLVRVNVELGEG